MKLLKCKLCRGEVDLVNSARGIIKQTKCRRCGFSNEEVSPKGPEIVIIRKRPIKDD